MERCKECGVFAKILGYGSASARPRWYCEGCGREWWGKYPLAQALARKAAVALNASRTPEERTEAARNAAFARSESMTQEQRSDIARRAVQERWAKKKRESRRSK